MYCLPTIAGVQVATGTYSNSFRLLGTESGGGGGDQLLEASRDPQRKRLQSAKASTASAGADCKPLCSACCHHHTGIPQPMARSIPIGPSYHFAFLFLGYV